MKIAAAAATASPINKITAITGEIARFLFVNLINDFKNKSLQIFFLIYGYHGIYRILNYHNPTLFSSLDDLYLHGIKEF